jgi:hypothetical protein
MFATATKSSQNNGSDAPLFATNHLNLIVPQSAIPTTVVDGSLVAATNFVANGSVAIINGSVLEFVRASGVVRG